MINKQDRAWLLLVVVCKCAFSLSLRYITWRGWISTSLWRLEEKRLEENISIQYYWRWTPLQTITTKYVVAFKIRLSEVHTGHSLVADLSLLFLCFTSLYYKLLILLSRPAQYIISPQSSSLSCPPEPIMIFFHSTWAVIHYYLRFHNRVLQTHGTNRCSHNS